MTIPEIKKLALELMIEHGLTQKGWTLRFDNSKRRAGLCCESWKGNYISLSRVVMPLKTDESVKDTILHEIAHALVGCKHGHNSVWVRKAKEIGCKGERCYKESAFVEGGKEAILSQAKYHMTCQNCGNVSAAHRKPKRKKACGKCCRKYNNGKYTDQFELILTQNY